MEYHGIEKLRGADNWNVWKFVVKNLLRGTENAHEVYIGEIAKPIPLPENATSQQQNQYRENLKAWDKADRAANQIIVKTLDTKVMALLVSCETARDMWLKLHTIYEQQTKQASHTVQSEFLNFSMDPSDEMVTHIAKFEGLVLRMQQLNVKPDELSLTVKLLDTLPEEYESLRQAWWARAEDQQTFGNLLEVLTSDDARRKIRVGKQEQMAALVVSKSRKHDRGNTSGNVKKSQSQQPNEKGKYNPSHHYKCYSCGEKRYFCQNCPKKQKKPQDHSPKEEAFVCEAMTAELDNDSWVVNSGATDHVTNRGDWFTSFEYFKTPAKIYIGNKTTMDALGKGTIKIETLVDGKWLP
ncbi:integrase core domain protein [Lasius niger]|uniref:Integrase core domain protein n=1 Tax=Lasius niger TaxID=67767 RepID=A0A0J7KAF6_LASNI|nr:integrase core domain protein [Lasius niger]